MFSEHFYPNSQKLETQECPGDVFSPTPRNWRELEHPVDVFTPR